MSILIKDMGMPSFGNEIIIRIQSDGGILDQYGHHLNCEAVPVPSHGDLIDRDAFPWEKQLKRKFHLWQKARVERKLFALRKRLLDILAEEGKNDKQGSI